MTRAELVGRWITIPGPYEKSVDRYILDLRPDGTVVNYSETGVLLVNNKCTETWEYLDENHWKYRMEWPPDPSEDWRTEGAIDSITYEVESYDGKRMVLTQYDYEEPSILERLP